MWLGLAHADNVSILRLTDLGPKWLHLQDHLRAVVVWITRGRHVHIRSQDSQNHLRILPITGGLSTLKWNHLGFFLYNLQKVWCCCWPLKSKLTVGPLAGAANTDIFRGQAGNLQGLVTWNFSILCPHRTFGWQGHHYSVFQFWGSPSIQQVQVSKLQMQSQCKCEMTSLI